ncbi:hypothetical protein [Deinococcus aquiradiocola]|uniref:Lipoprotein n=1 Tax=Deinococcus aquiradiocola TaxID=393059 RepID=A0A917UUY7_9DEIO|nr:hypothetical protein [Deinococcus aquiradiocola]GGJ87183.1 hypothetical protein GCM10008939_33980 [Deinococcus aquiradiocola]
MKRLVLFSGLALLALTSCNTLFATHSLSAVFVAYAPSGSCPDLSITNHGRDSVSFLTANTSVSVDPGMSRPLAPILGGETIGGRYPINGGTLTSSDPYSYDFGFKCSPNTPEVRGTYRSFATINIKEDPSIPSGLSITVKEFDPSVRP